MFCLYFGRRFPHSDSHPYLSVYRGQLYFLYILIQPAQKINSKIIYFATAFIYDNFTVNLPLEIKSPIVYHSNHFFH